MNVFRENIAAREIQDVILTNSGCAGLCAKEPMITVEVVNSAPVKYILVDKEKARKIFEEHVLGGKVVEDYALAIGSETMAT
jgi:NADP-reducing hydrogenase subunit HndB